MTNSDAEFLAEVENRYPPLAGTYMSLVPRVVIPRLVAMVRERDARIAYLQRDVAELRSRWLKAQYRLGPCGEEEANTHDA